MVVMALVVAVAGLLGHGQLDELDREIASLQAQRAKLRTYSDVPEREKVDRRIRMLERVREEAIAVIDLRVSACAATVAPGPQPNATVAGIPTACLAMVRNVVPTLLRIEELRAQSETKRDWGSRDERAAIEAEIKALQASLVR